MKILIVEDDHEIRESLRMNFEAESFAVDVAEDGEQGSSLARINDYDLIVLDYILPTKDGKEVCREVRAKGKSVPIIILSVQSELPTKIEMLNIGADDYVTKPFSFEELLARVRAVLRRPGSIVGNVLQIGDLTLDSAGHNVKRGNDEIYLTRKEFELLEYMMRNTGKVLSRGMIMEHVWDGHADPFSNTIETHILNLRKKIDSRSPHKLIHTVPTRGYKIAL